MNRHNIQTALRAVFLITFSVSCLFAAGKSKVKSDLPDFAYPKTVVKNSESSLKKNLNTKNYVGALRSLIDLIVADNMISNENTLALLPRVDTIAKELPAPYSALTYLLEAQLYSEIYESTRYRANSRIQTEDAVDELNPQFWDESNFSDKISSLLLQALSQKEEALNMNLKEIKSLLTDSEYISELSVYDFIVYKSLQIKGSLPANEATIPFFKTKTATFPSKENLIDGLLAEHPEATNARMIAIIEKLNLMEPERGARFLWDEIQKNTEADYTIPLTVLFYRRFLKNNEPKPLAENEDGADNALCSKTEFFGFLNNLREKYKNSPQIGNLNKVYEEMTFPEVSLSSSATVIPSHNFPVRIEADNINDFYVLLIETPDVKESRIKVSKLRGHRVVDQKRISNALQAPFTYRDTIEFAVTKPGNYALVASGSTSLNDILVQKRSDYTIPVFRATDIDILLTNIVLGNDSTVTDCYVVNAENSAPLENAEVKLQYSEGYGKPQKTITYTTDSEGMTPIEQPGEITATYKGNKAFAIAYNYFGTKPKPKNNIRLFTSQSVYRPGDKIEFFGIVYHEDINKGEILTQKDIEISLLDANRQKIDSISTVSDISGRIYGGFTVPKDGLLGAWRLSAKIKGVENENSYTNTFTLPVQIEEYRVPPFLLTLGREETTDSIKFSGCARTYSGMPVTYADVTYNIDYQPSYFYRWRYSNPQKYTSVTQTDAEGNFHICLPLNNLNLEDYRGIFTITATATDGTGETVKSEPVRFWLVPDYTISGIIPGKVEITSDELQFDIKVNDPVGLPVQKIVEYTVEKSDGETIQKGEFTSPLFKLATDSLESGEYIFKFHIAGSEKTDTAVFSSILFRLTDRKPPVEKALWIPNDKYTAQAGAKNVDVIYGSSYPGQRLLCIISGSDGLLQKKWLVSDGTNAVVKVLAPKPDERVFVNFLTYRDHTPYIEEVTVIPETQLKKFEIKTETFRNKVTAGDKEDWKFRITYGDKPTEGFAYALLYDKAMDAVCPLNWNTRLFSPAYPRSVSCTGQWNSSLYFTFSSKSPVYAEAPAVPIFNFQTYGYPLYSRFTYNNLHITKRAMATKADAGGMMQNSYGALAMEAPVAEEASFRAMDDLAATTESADEERQEGNGENPAQEFRPIEMPVALFRPNLATDTKGELSIDFTVPNFNTTWNLMLGAYNAELLSTSTQLETLASKSVMVKMNAPRFVRTGDEIIFSATIYNNTAANMLANGEYEIFNPDTGETLANSTYSNISIEPSGNKVFTISFKCPTDISTLGLRVFGKTDNASDGEETIIPVLPSSQPVVESDPFYLQPDRKEFEMAMPEFKEGASVTFTYCDNPVWEVVTTLSPLAKTESETVTALMDAFYANCTGQGLLERNPSMKKGLQLIVSGEAGDSLLISNLQKNQELKTVSLNNTPWVNNAANETLRLSRLSTLLDKESADKEIATLWQKIVALQNSDGGWSWCKEMKSSEWITRNVLTGLALLKQNGHLPDLPALSSAINKAVRYCDNKIVEDYSKTRKQDREIFLRNIWDYLYLRSFFDNVKMSTGYSEISKNALKEIEKDWKHLDIFDKASVAILLHRKEKQKTALEILESLREFTTESPQGVYFDNQGVSRFRTNKLATTAQVITAFNEIRPQDSLIDGLRQWLVMQKQTQDWQERSSTLYVVNAILTSGSSWSEEYSMPEITIAGIPVAVGEIERLTGSCKVDINLKEVKEPQITIKRSTPTPAWGGLISQYIAPMAEVKAAETADLKVTKEFLKLEERNGKTTATRTTDFNIGDKVRINLIIECGKESDYVVINDERAACMEPMAQISGYTAIDGVWCYRELRNNATNIFIPTLPKGRFVISYDCSIMESGMFSSGIATVQSLYAPVFTAHTAGNILTVK